MIRMAPLKVPAEPTPATALPMISAILLGATPQMRDPSSKILLELVYTQKDEETLMWSGIPKGSQEYPFDGKECVELAEEELKSTSGK
jgi:hypothetical protein